MTYKLLRSKLKHGRVDLSTLVSTILYVGLADKPLAFRAWYGLLAVQTRCEDRVSADLEREAGLPLSWFELLAHLSWHPDGRERMSELADELLLSRGGATRLVARLEEAGLLVREVPPSDRRATFAVITPQGRKTFERALPVLLPAVDRHFGALLEEEELEELTRLMSKVLQVLDPGCAAYHVAHDETEEVAAAPTPHPPRPS